MLGFRAICRVGIVVILFVSIALTALYGLLKPISSGCIMTYMYPTYIPISTPANVSSDKYGLFLYHEGWKKIDFTKHVKKLGGVPVLFIPGNGGSYKQVRSLAAESSRAYQAGPLEPTFHQEATSLAVEHGKSLLLEDLDGFELPSVYSRTLDWFAVDLEGEHSAMDGRILEEHTEYVVYAIHRILDQYQESREAQSKEGAEVSGSLPTSVILVGHSMGGFVARAAVVHPHLRKSAVETILTLSSPHQSPPIALQPSLGHYFSQVNGEWKKGYDTKTTLAGRIMANPTLSRVIVISVSGGVHDFQVRSKLASLDGIVPSTHGFMISSSGMKNVWLSMDHQSILWCNQLVVQMSHTLLSLINPETGYPFPSARKRLVVFTKMLQSGIPQSLNWKRHMRPYWASKDVPIDDANVAAGSQPQGSSTCPPSVHWKNDGLEKDLYIRSTSVTVLAMDGKRRWMDITNQGSTGKAHFIFVTNLAPCSGVRLHLWPEKSKSPLKDEMPAKRILEVTSKMVQIPAGPAPRQIEPGSQTEQAPPSAMLLLSPEQMHGFRFLTISVAPSPTISGRPPPAASMAVGQFYSPEDGQRELSPMLLLRSSYVHEEMFLKEDHPLALNLSFSVSLGLLPVTLSLETAGCGLKSSALPEQHSEDDVDHSSICKLRCFPPVAFAWDSISGLHITPNLYSETVIVDSSPAMWDSGEGSDRTIVLLLVDPHCSYKVSIEVSLLAAASRFCLLYSSQIIGFMIAVVFFALMRQARAWELDLTLPSILAAVEYNLRMPFPFLLLVILPTIVSIVLSLLTTGIFPPVMNFLCVSIGCFLIANGSVVGLILSSQVVLYMTAILHVSLKRWWQALEENFCFTFLRQILDFSSIFYSLKIVQILRGSPRLVVAFITIPFVCFVHPALGLVILLFSHALHSHTALCSFLAASFRSHAQRKEFYNSQTEADSLSSKHKATDAFNPLLPLDESNSTSPSSVKSFGDSQLEIFGYQHGLLILHLLATLMFMPSLVAWLQVVWFPFWLLWCKRIGMSQRFPWFLDSALCVGIILHGLCGSRREISSFSIPLFPGHEIGLSLVYLIAGYYSFLSALFSTPYKSLYAMAAIGIISFGLMTIERRNRDKGDGHFRSSRRHSHRH